MFSVTFPSQIENKGFTCLLVQPIFYLQKKTIFEGLKNLIMRYFDLVIPMFVFIFIFYAFIKRNAFKNGTGTVSFTSINAAGLCLIFIAILFVVEYFIVEGMYDSLNSNSLEKISYSTKNTYDKIKICGIIQVILLLFAGIIFLTDDSNSNISERIKKLEKINGIKN